MEELWKDINEYENYQISNFGNVKSKRYWVGNRYVYKDKLLKPSLSSSGYQQVVLCKNGKTKNHFIHRLVANHFLENTNNSEEINHIDENKQNNNVNNLEWCDHKYNMNYGKIKNKISNSHKKKVAKYNNNGDLIKIYESIEMAANENNTKSTNIVQCCKHKDKYKTCKGYVWKYV